MFGREPDSFLCPSSISSHWRLYTLDINIHVDQFVLVEQLLARSFNFMFRCIDDVLSLNNSRFGDFVDRIYPIELEINDTTDTDRSASYLDLHLDIDSEGRFKTKPYGHDI